MLLLFAEFQGHSQLLLSQVEHNHLGMVEVEGLVVTANKFSILVMRFFLQIAFTSKTIFRRIESNWNQNHTSLIQALIITKL